MNAMPTPIELGRAPPAALLDGAVALALATGAPLRFVGPIEGADAALVLAAVRLCSPDNPAALDLARAALGKDGAVELPLGRPRAGNYALQFDDARASARAVTSLVWPLALAGRPSALRLLGPNHAEGAPTFHELRLCWAPLAGRFGLRIGLEMPAAGFDSEAGEIVAELEPVPALQPLQLVHRGLLQQASVVAATTGGSHEEPLLAAQRAAKRLRAHGIIAEAERVPMPHVAQSGPRWALTGVIEFERSLACASAVPARSDPRLKLSGADPSAEQAGDRVAERLAAFLSRRGALDGVTAERLLVPAVISAAGLGARAGPPPASHFTTSEVTEGLLALAQLARKVLPVRAAVDGAQGEEGVVVVTPYAQ